MNKHLMLKAIAEHFNSVTPDFVVSKLKEFGCEFDDIVSYPIKPTHLESLDFKASSYQYVELNADTVGIKKATTCRSDFFSFKFSRSSISHSSNDETYAQMNEAA